MEIWKAVIGYEGLYEVSDMGRVRSLSRYVPTKGGAMRLTKLKMLTPHANRNGYMHVGLARDGKAKTENVHDLVLKAFAGPRPDDMEARHGAGGKSDNSLPNLCWGTRQQNAADKIDHGTAPVGENNPKAKLTNGQVLEIYNRAVTGEDGASIAAEFGISTITVSHILCGRTWSHVTGAIYEQGRVVVTGNLKEQIAELKSDGRTLSEIAMLLAISRSTAFRHSK